MSSPNLSVIICTYNRAALLKGTLASLTTQTLDQDRFEVIIIDDGSCDDSREVFKSFSDKLPIRYFYQENAGLASAKNHGIYVARHELLFFFDDDDVATPPLLEEHVKTHIQYPQDNFAVLNYTGWSPSLEVTPLMRFVTEVGFFLFSYPEIKHSDVHDYTRFWGGRSSCKRGFLIKHGVFNQVFRFGCEDIELGYRLAKHGLRVVYNSDAISLMARPVTFDGFCNRLVRQGRSQYVFHTLHDAPEVAQWTEVRGATEKWNEIKAIYESKLRSARELEKLVATRNALGLDVDNDLTRLLYRAYWWAFKASKVKGIAQAAESALAEAAVPEPV